MCARIIVCCVLVQVFLVKSFEVHEDVDESTPPQDVKINVTSDSDEKMDDINATSGDQKASSGKHESRLPPRHPGNSRKGKNGPKKDFITMDNVPNSGRIKEKLISLNLGGNRPEPVFVPSPEVKAEPSDSNSDSFQPVENPLSSSTNQPSSTTSTTMVPTERTTNTNTASKRFTPIFPEVKTTPRRHDLPSERITGAWIEKSTENVPSVREINGWKILGSEEQPESKILTSANPESPHASDRKSSTTTRPLYQTITPSFGSHPYPFELVGERDIKWFEPPVKDSTEGYTEELPLPPPPPPPLPPLLPPVPPLLPPVPPLLPPVPPQFPPAETDHECEHPRVAGKEIISHSRLHSFLHILSAFIPIGLLLSALTPKVVVINPNATSNTFGQAPLNPLFNRRLRSLETSTSTPVAETNFRDAISKLMKELQDPKMDPNCVKLIVCQSLALIKDQIDIGSLQKTISFILRRRHAQVGEVNVSLGEVIEAARKDNCSIYTCEMITASDASASASAQSN